MSPEENFDHKLLIFTACAVAEVARCLEAAGALDDLAKRTIRLHLADLSEAGTAVEHPAQLRFLDGLVQTFPPLPR